MDSLMKSLKVKIKQGGGNMFVHFLESMLTEYFTIQFLFEPYLIDSKKVFTKLGKMYLLSSKEIEEQYSLASSNIVQEITSEKEYYQFKRIEEYTDITHQDFVTDQAIKQMVHIKGKCIGLLNGLKIQNASESSLESVKREIIKNANEGKLLALNILGFLQIEGILYDKNEIEGIKNLRKAASWNDEKALIKIIYQENKNEDKKALCFILHHLEQKEAVFFFYKQLEKEKDTNFHIQNIKIRKILLKAFEMGILNESIYNKQYARILFSELIEYHDIETIFLSSDQNLIRLASMLPLKLSTKTKISMNQETIKYLENKDSNIQKIILSLKNIDLCQTSNYRPMCIVSESSYLLENRYQFCIENTLQDVNMEKIEVADLTAHDLDSSMNNIFIRLCDEDDKNVYCLFFRGEIPTSTFDFVKNFLQTSKRSFYRLNTPSVVLNMKAILPICFSDPQNAKQLEPYCDMIYIHGFTYEEKKQLVEEFNHKKEEVYGFSKIQIDENIYSKLLAQSIDRIVRILDDIMKENRNLSNELYINEEMLSSYSNHDSIKKSYGFGGRYHENR